ncbi:nucleoside-diphosphate kinase [Periweissella fabaria]|uniref:nucleoside-diphosphate kinase n=1 Tax=Periweissella fabaria TaxID=546157 RepID=A0ABM8Z6K6_9LACO|nr:nucleoside-diphosphate kinase [Periweissella fabaria]MCM0597000.1 nucleoside-diphosphate kinase [Periweissella fabaria]CAH0416955.1 Nucleoside diphosphate kinase [Periweissella fabaria]
MHEERTLILVKPDGVSQGHIGEVITRLERKGYRIEALKVTNATRAQLDQHYEDKVDKPFYPEMVKYMQEGPIVAIIAAGISVVSVFRRMAGKTNVSEADFGTIRGDFGREWGDGIIRNVVHSSDSVEHAEREIAIWFELKNVCF